MSSSTPRLSFIDWMKAVGICVIVVGHVASRTIDWMTPPIYPKQLGVAFFVFVTGYTLARERRSSSRVLFKRLFHVYLYGIAVALVVSVHKWITLGDLAESNYLPFVAGVNVLFNFFPANPSTWYIGTYLHLLLLWAFVLRDVRVRPWMVACGIVVEFAVRALLIAAVGGVLPYMLLTNWIVVLTLGLMAGQQGSGEGGGCRVVPSVMLMMLLAGWSVAAGRLVGGTEFPWMAATVGSSPWNATVVSALVTVLYSVVTLLLFRVTRSMPVPAAVRALSGQTLFIFIAHMPVFYWLTPLLTDAGLSYPARSVVLVLTCLVGLGVCGAAVNEVTWRYVSHEAICARVVARWPSRGDKSKAPN